MSVRIGINGFGRMGRPALRAAFDRAEFTALPIVHINEIKGGAGAAVHLLEFDSVRGRWPAPVGAENFAHRQSTAHRVQRSGRAGSGAMGQLRGGDGFGMLGEISEPRSRYGRISSAACAR